MWAGLGIVIFVVTLELCDNSLAKHSLKNILNQPSLVSPGLSLNHSTVSSIKMRDRSRGSGVRCILSLSNWSMFTLLDVETNTECGQTSKLLPPRNVFPGIQEVMLM